MMNQLTPNQGFQPVKPVNTFSIADSSSLCDQRPHSAHSFVCPVAMVGLSEHIYDTEFKDGAQTLARAGFLELNALSRFTVQTPSHQDGS
jgi:hypothetical protein